jgi:hypothetical protein
MMKTLILAAGALVTAAVPAQAESQRNGEAELARALEGRVPGKPVDCVRLNQVRSSRIIDGTAILYEEGGTIYVNRPRRGAESLSNWDTLVTKTFGSELCSIDVVRLYDLSAHMERGAVFLGEFVPYRRPPRNAPSQQ